jgi:3-oxoacyl-[acyl-carrier protein] reductase
LAKKLERMERDAKPQDMLDFSGKTVLVVGGSSGIGNGIARAFCARGAKVYVWGTRASANDYAGVEGSDLSDLEYAFIDVSDFESVEVAQVPFDALDVLILCQGTVIYQRGEFTLEGWRKVVAVNLDSLMACALRFRAMLQQSKGSIVVVSSVSGFKSSKGNPAYASSKAGAIGFTRTLASAWASEGIRVNGLAPGLVDTKLTKVTTGHPKRLEAMLAGVPAGRMGTPDEMAGAALFLASPLSSYVYGHTIAVDGGMMAS